MEPKMKLAFVMIHDWLTSPFFSIRAYFLSLYKKLHAEGYDVDLVTYRSHYTGNRWFRVFPEDWFIDSFYKETVIADSFDFYDNYSMAGKIISPDFSIQYLGISLDDIYDCVVFTFSMLMNSNPIINSKSQILIVYDFLPNKAAMDRYEPGLQEFAYLHAVGMNYIKEKNGYFLSISKKTDDEIAKFYKPNSHDYLPPVTQPAFHDVHYTNDIPKENSVVLAAPIEIRKGVEIMPTILNRLCEKIDALYIFGRSKSEKSVHDKFFNALKIDKIIYYRDITGNDLVELYKKCKFLLFPSLEEGLGMPLIEAQMCGCRVITTNKEPMNKLVLDGGYLLCDDLENNIKMIRSMFDDEFDHEALSKKANEIFSIDHVYKKFKTVLYDFQE
jgi:glycosyltransferase involved in cell wall biosynthesis